MRIVPSVSVGVSVSVPESVSAAVSGTVDVESVSPVVSPLSPGVYQFRVTALRKGATIPTSLSEDLRGVFRVQ